MHRASSYRMPRRLLLISIFCLSAIAFGEAHSILLQLAPLSLGIVGGRPTEKHRYVVELVGSDGGICTGTLLEGGCVLTARHCKRRGVTYTVKSGKEGATTISRGSEFETWGKDDDAQTDAAILKLQIPVSSEMSLNRSVLAEERPAIPKDGVVEGEIVGYGMSGTEEKNETWKDVGAGTKRAGSAALLGFGGAVDETALLGRAVSTRGNILWVSRSPNIAARGDSGGPLIVDGKIVGIAAEVQGKLLMGKDGERPPGYETKPLAQEVTGAQYTSVADNHKEIIKAMDRAKCSENSLESVTDSLKSALKGDRARFDWADVKGPVRTAVETQVRRLYGIPADRAITIEPLKSAAGVARFNVTFRDGGRDQVRGPVDLDLRE